MARAILPSRAKPKSYKHRRKILEAKANREYNSFLSEKFPEVKHGGNTNGRYPL